MIDKEVSVCRYIYVYMQHWQIRCCAADFYGWIRVSFYYLFLTYVPFSPSVSLFSTIASISYVPNPLSFL